MVERRIELGRRNHRKLKMRKLKAKLGGATGEAREKLLYKIKRLSPWWTEAAASGAAPAAKSEEPKKKPAAPKKKA
jgi:hypothetical protein